MKDIKQVMESGSSPLATAVSICEDAIKHSKEKFIYEKSPILRAMHVVLDSFGRHREAIKYAAALVNTLENKEGKPEDIIKYIMAFKIAAVAARIQQKVQVGTPEVQQ